MVCIEARRQKAGGTLLVLITVNGLAIIRIHITKRELDKTGQAMRGAKHLMSAKFLLPAANF